MKTTYGLWIWASLVAVLLAACTAGKITPVPALAKLATPDPVAFHHPDQQIHDWIVNGKLGVGRQMPALGDQLTDGEVHAVIDYLHTLWTEEQLAAQQDITSRWPATPEPTLTPQP
jgi:hypothetical protein